MWGTNNKLLADTIYDDITLVYSSHYFYYNYNNAQNDGKPKVMTWLTQKDGKEALLDNSGKWIRDASSIKSRLMDYSLGDNPDYPLNYGQKFPKLIAADSLKRRLIKSALREPIYQRFLQRSSTSKPGVNSQNQGLILSSPHPLTHTNFSLEYLHKNAFTLKSWSYMSNSDRSDRLMQDSEIVDWDNYVIKNGQLKRINITDIFGNGDLLKTELTKAIQKREDLNLDCSTIDNFADLVGNDFSLHEEGVILHMKRQQYSGQLVDLLVPWANLRSRAESGWLVKILGK